ncbi:kinase-like domain-containing protein [Mycena epipterygia]|nr:kinase-like domain-containing protein [Mycena epipterygia]
MPSQTSESDPSEPSEDCETWVATQPADDPCPGTGSVCESEASWEEVVILYHTSPEPAPVSYETPLTTTRSTEYHSVAQSARNLDLLISFPSLTVKPDRKLDETGLREPTTPPPNAESAEGWSIKKSDKICTVYDHSKFKYIGQGRSSVVYSATRLESDVEVAVKRMRFKDDPKSLKSAIRCQSDNEIAILQSLKGLSGVSQIIEVFREANTVDIVLELVSGGDLSTQTLDRDLGEETTKHIARQICATMAKLHRNNVVHRDVKLQNILLDDSAALPTIKIADFGSAKRPLAEMKTFCGSTAYMAPERMRGTYGPAVDMWSVGITLALLLVRMCWQIITNNERAISKRPQVAQMLHCLKENGISPKGQDFIRQLLQIEPNDRMTFEDALEHPWLLPTASQSDGKDTGVEHCTGISFCKKELDPEEVAKRRTFRRIFA